MVGTRSHASEQRLPTPGMATRGSFSRLCGETTPHTATGIALLASVRRNGPSSASRTGFGWVADPELTADFVHHLHAGRDTAGGLGRLEVQGGMSDRRLAVFQGPCALAAADVEATRLIERPVDLKVGLGADSAGAGRYRGLPEAGQEVP